MLYLELVSYRDLFAVATPRRRLDHAKLIASKFLIPQQSQGSNELNNPLFDLRPMFPVEVLTTIQESMTETIGLDFLQVGLNFFQEIESCIEDSLAGAKFASFLLSDECARMRAYMRGTSPYIDPPLESIVCESSLDSSPEYSAGRNHLEFILVYLLCQKENDALDKNYDKEVYAKDPKRLMGSAGGLSCAVFISRVLLPAMDKATKQLAGYTGSESENKVFGTLISTFEKFWESFIAPDGGVLDSASYSNETYDIIEQMRETMLKAANPPEETKKEDRLVVITRSFALDEDFIQSLSRLRDELLYGYYVNNHSKYRAHAIHEWMCGEANDALQKSSSDENKIDTVKFEAIPRLSNGSISRLVRRIELPEGISRHCPVHKPQNQSLKKKQIESAKCNFNADFAIVFTSDTSDPSESESSEHPHIQQIMSFDQSSLQRAACVPLSDHAKHQMEKLSLEQILPATLVSYAMIPTFKNRPFKETIYYGRNT